MCKVSLFNERQQIMNLNARLLAKQQLTGVAVKSTASPGQLLMA